MDTDELVSRLVAQSNSDERVKLKFFNRLSEGKLSRSQNPTSHVCVYFPAYDPKRRMIFIGHHKKSGLWLANGGHLNDGETPKDAVVREAKEEWGLTLVQKNIPDPALVTLTEIEHPRTQICEWHYDLWHFLPFDSAEFLPNVQHLSVEFAEYGWKPYEEAKNFISDSSNITGLAYLLNH